MDFKDFLMKNYIFIVIVIVLIIITIIGFLVDKKKNGGDKKKSTDNQNAQPPVAADATTVQQPAMPAVNNVNTVPNQDANAGMVNTGNAPVAMPDGSGMNMPSQSAPVGAPMPVEPINNVPSNPEPMYQPLSEQKPTFASAEVNNVSPMPVDLAMNQMANQTPSMGGVMPNVSAVEPMAQVNPQPMPSQAPNPSNVVQNEIQPQGPVPVTTPQQMPNTNVAVQNPGPIPSPVPQPMPNQGGNVNPTPIPASTPTSPSAVSFVFGPQQNNNQNM